MTITINTDASYHPVHKVGAFAFWIVWDGGRLIKSGPLKTVNNVQDAELQSIGNALYVILKGDFKNVQHVYVNTDCQTGINALDKGHKINQCGDTIKKVRSMVSKLISKYGYTKKKNKFKTFISWRYVESHSKGEDARRWVNNKIDEMAKEALWKLINQK